MRIGLVTTYNESCGIAEYAKNIVGSLQGQVDFDIYDRDRWNTDTLMNGDFDILHLNHSTSLMGWLTIVDITRIKATGKKVVMTLHDSSSFNRCQFTDIFDKVIVHEKTYEDNCTYIPHGMPELTEEERNTPVTSNALGTAGFPIWHKGFTVVAEASAILGRGCYMIAPASRHADTNAVEQDVRRYNGNTIYIKEYLSQIEVVRHLNQNAEVMVFPYISSGPGISGAVRMGLATGKPVVLTRCQQFHDLYDDYSDEVEFTEYNHNSAQDIAEAVNKVLENGKRPKRILEDMGWGKVSQQYKKMYEEVCGVLCH